MDSDQLDQAWINQVVDEVLTRLCPVETSAQDQYTAKILRKPDSLPHNVIPFPKARLGC